MLEMHTADILLKRKLNILSNADYKKLTQLLAPHLKRIIEQENFYIDTEAYKFFHAGCMIRLRFDSIVYPLAEMIKKCTMAIRGRMEMSSGVINLIEKDELLEVDIGRDLISRLVLVSPSPVHSLDDIKTKHGIVDDVIFVGGFTNTRLIFTWHGVVLEVDKYIYVGGPEYYQIQYWPNSTIHNEM
jgi:uncharacterized protein YjbK